MFPVSACGLEFLGDFDIFHSRLCISNFMVAVCYLGVLPIMGCSTGRLCRRGVAFFRLMVYKRTGILQV